MNKTQFLHILCGFPGTGKSTWCSLHVARRTIPYTVLSTDALIEEHAKRMGTTYDQVFLDYIDIATREYNAALHAALAARSNLVIDRTNLTKKSRATILQLVPSEYYKTAVVFTCSVINQSARLASRVGKNIPDHVIKQMFRNYQDPTLSEGFDDIIYIDTDKSIKELEGIGL